jgi:hypothetical protein
MCLIYNLNFLCHAGSEASKTLTRHGKEGSLTAGKMAILDG